MKAEDTVMSPERLQEVYGAKYADGDIEGVAKWQAIWSFRAGIKEVVEWLRNYPSDKGFMEGYFITIQELKEKLKELGIDA